MSNLVVREVMNGTWFILTLCLTLAFVLRIACRMASDANWYGDVGCQAAIALLVHFVGSVMRSGWIWLLLHCQNAARECSAIENNYDVLIVASAFAVIGTLCCIRVFSPVRLRPWTWMLAGAAAIAIPVGVYVG